MPPKAAAMSPLCPLCNKTTMIRNKQTNTWRTVIRIIIVGQSFLRLPWRPATLELHGFVWCGSGIHKAPFCHLPCRIQLNFKTCASTQCLCGRQALWSLNNRRHSATAFLVKTVPKRVSFGLTKSRLPHLFYLPFPPSGNLVSARVKSVKYIHLQGAAQEIPNGPNGPFHNVTQTFSWKDSNV